MRIVFWNTSVAPSARTRKDHDETVFIEMVRSLLVDVNANVLVLCEVSSLQEKAISVVAEKSGHSIQSGFHEVGRSKFDLFLLYSRDVDLIRKPTPILFHEGERNFRAALRFDLRLTEIDTMLYLYGCHWPSRLQPESEHVRSRLAATLRNDLERQGVLSGRRDAIVVGDFNDEPHDNSLVQSLRATRDRSLVIRRPHLLFNASWNQMGTCVHTQGSERCLGTYFHKGGDATRWRTFDQMIFSSSLLLEGGWRLSDEGCLTLASPWYSEYVTNGPSHFDHFPVLCALENTMSEITDD